VVNSYVDDKTGVFINKLGITDAEQLKAIEHERVRQGMRELLLQPIPGSFDLAHYSQIHAKLFSPLYKWAGEVRTGQASSRTPGDSWVARYASPARIQTIDAEVQRELRDANYLRGINRFDAIDTMARVYAKWNEMHPFVAGNGRAARTMMQQLANNAGYRLDYSKVAPLQWQAAALQSMERQHMREHGFTRPGDTDALKGVLNTITVLAPQHKATLTHGRGRSR
jgi:cell filamentation protein